MRGVTIKRAYESPGPDDGYRVLVDRLWPRGVKKEDLPLDLWLKEIAPSAQLRVWFGHDPAKWEEFRRMYRQELAAPVPGHLLDDLAEWARTGPVTLVYAARDEQHNGALVLKELLDEKTGAGDQRDVHSA